MGEYSMPPDACRPTWDRVSSSLDCILRMAAPRPPSQSPQINYESAQRRRGSGCIKRGGGPPGRQARAPSSAGVLSEVVCAVRAWLGGVPRGVLRCQVSCDNQAHTLPGQGTTHTDFIKPGCKRTVTLCFHVFTHSHITSPTGYCYPGGLFRGMNKIAD
ncbi:hypothetical protein AAFF_G00237760 [Aldrovandia affinis]|uniref:Uncharacterized protein n=1 Tax=Aldrovandia affinis TaxID=143900 RepID=A0AAD7W4K0_9TELE|nr:hypothetical protein AAFF_G00237760 [Aldrovandia affinis]